MLNDPSSLFEPWELIKKLEAVSGRLEKEASLKEAFLQDKEGTLFQGLRLALDSTITFGIKQVEERFGQLEEVFPGLTMESFIQTAEKLQRRELTGHAARDCIHYLKLSATNDQWNYWYRRILIKDLRCGVDTKTVNKVLKSLKRDLIPVFECQLAQDSAKHDEKLTGKKLLQHKLDGIRVISILYPNGTVSQFSRNGKELHNFELIKNRLALLTEEVRKLNEPLILDGEVMSNSFQELMKQAHRKSNIQTDEAKLYLFDCLPLSSFLNGGKDLDGSFIKQRDRISSLKGWINQHTDLEVLEQSIEVLPSTEVDLDSLEGVEQFKEFNREAIRLGLEGIMIKDPEAPYECKRSSNWLKLKPFIEVSLTIVDFEEGTGKNEGSLGALVCEGLEEDKKIKVNVGTGLSEEQRKDFWVNKDRLLNHVVEIRADAITKSQDEKNDFYSLRFPRFLRFRGFEINEKI